MSEELGAGPDARFIVGTGRCGSTILSKMLDLHPDVAVLSELMICFDFHRKWGERDVSGAELVDLLDCGLASTGEMKKIAVHLATPEISFDAAAAPAPVDASRYRDGVLPDLLLLPLGHLFDDPPAIFDEILAFARAQPVRLLSAQYARLFDWIARRAGKTAWIERSGGSIASLPELVELFPRARYLHLHRDPLDVALSMRAHHHFRLRAFAHYDLETAEGIRWSDLDERDLNGEGPMSERLRGIFDHPVPLEYFLRDWSDCTLRGMRAVRDLDADQYAELCFEDLMRDPAAALRSIVAFFELPEAGEGWIDEACALLRSGQAAHAEPDAEQARLMARECQAAMVLMGRAPAMTLYR
jgi:putative sulfotransferase